MTHSHKLTMSQVDLTETSRTIFWYREHQVIVDSREHDFEVIVGHDAMAGFWPPFVIRLDQDASWKIIEDGKKVSGTFHDWREAIRHHIDDAH